MTVNGTYIDTSFSLGSGLVGLIAEVKQLQSRGDLRAIVNKLDLVARNPAKIVRSLPPLVCEETLLYHDESVTVYHISTPPGVLYPPHEHGMVAITCIYSGEETHIFYQREEDELKTRGEVTFNAPMVVDLQEDAVHAICNQGSEPTESLHFYLGDLENQQRTLWDVDGDNPRQYVHDDYLQAARPMADVGLTSS